MSHLRKLLRIRSVGVAMFIGAVLIAIWCWPSSRAMSPMEKALIGTWCVTGDPLVRAKVFMQFDAARTGRFLVSHRPTGMFEAEFSWEVRDENLVCSGTAAEIWQQLRTAPLMSLTQFGAMLRFQLQTCLDSTTVRSDSRIRQISPDQLTVELTKMHARTWMGWIRGGEVPPAKLLQTRNYHRIEFIPDADDLKWPGLEGVRPLTVRMEEV